LVPSQPRGHPSGRRIGGTFTDFVCLDGEGREVALGKGSTTHGRFEDGVMDVLGEAAFDEVEFLAHGTTVTINTLTEHRGAVTALLTTRGFRDVLEITRANRPRPLHLLYSKPKPFVPRRLRLEVADRSTTRPKCWRRSTKRAYERPSARRGGRAPRRSEST
jgi:N-methylhydantoinase A